MRVFRVRYGYAYSLLKWFGFVASTQFWSWVQKRLLGPKRTGLSWHFFGGSKQSPPNVNKDTSWETLSVVFCHSFFWNLFVFRSIVTFAHKAQCDVSMLFPPNGIRGPFLCSSIDTLGVSQFLRPGHTKCGSRTVVRHFAKGPQHCGADAAVRTWCGHNIRKSQCILTNAANRADPRVVWPGLYCQKTHFVLKK